MDRWYWCEATPETYTFSVDEDAPGSLGHLYYTMESEGLTETFFYDGPAVYHSSFIDRISEETYKGYMWFYAPYADKEARHPLAFVMVNNFTGKCAMCHFCFFKEGLAQSHEIAKAWLKFIFSKPDGLECLIGLTPKPYRHAWKFAMDVGFKYLATLPKACHLTWKNRFCDGILTMYQTNNL